jgi:hypothetical protein
VIREKEVDAMWWEVAIPTLRPDGQQLGVQVFTYPKEEVPVGRLAKRLARADAISVAAIRHRRGARVDLGALTVAERELSD